MNVSRQNPFLNSKFSARLASREVYILGLLYTLLAFSPYAWTEPEMCLIPAGHFTMGSDDDLPNEAPVHKIYLDAYYIGKNGGNQRGIPPVLA